MVIHTGKARIVRLVQSVSKNVNRTLAFFRLLSAPARRALEHNGITSLEQLASYSEKEILKFHGMGPASMPKLRTALKEKGLSFKNE